MDKETLKNAYGFFALLAIILLWAWLWTFLYNDVFEINFWYHGRENVQDFLGLLAAILSTIVIVAPISLIDKLYRTYNARKNIVKGKVEEDINDVSSTGLFEQNNVKVIPEFLEAKTISNMKDLEAKSILATLVAKKLAKMNPQEAQEFRDDQKPQPNKKLSDQNRAKLTLSILTAKSIARMTDEQAKEILESQKLQSTETQPEQP
ncbi:hypothetical protein WG904_03435 [Pedobacter sp. Du54]|uniref:hypothetical protein n=1 Tax=Pedobacter anseongensis TaxID=3133439 RepID=UPI00309A38E1